MRRTLPISLLTLAAVAACTDAPEAPRSARTGDRMRPAPLPNVSLAGVPSTDLQLVFRHPTTGDVVYWMVRGGAVVRTGSYGSVPTAWRLVGPAGLSGDGASDLLWQHTPSNALVFWDVDYADNVTAVRSLAGTAPPPWRLAGTGSSRLLWWNPTTGELVLWQYYGAPIQSAIALGAVPTQWRIAATAYLNGDDWFDVLWENTTTGARVVWLMNQTSIASTVDLGVVPTNWSIAAVGDVDGDGNQDILWQDRSTGTVVAWRMSGTTYLGTMSPGSPPAPWILETARPSASGAGPFPVQVAIRNLTTIASDGSSVSLDVTNVRGTFFTSLYVDQGSFVVDSVRVVLGTAPIKCPTFVPGGPRIQQIDCAYNSAAVDASTGSPLVANGTNPFSVVAYYRPIGGGPTQAATGTLQQALIVNNP